MIPVSGNTIVEDLVNVVDLFHTSFVPFGVTRCGNAAVVNQAAHGQLERWWLMSENTYIR